MEINNNTEHKTYLDINIFAPKFRECLNKGDYISITEKIDGANASFQIINDKIYAYSRNTKLNQENNLRGFYEWANKLNTEKFKEYPNLRFFGEWLVKHSVVYPEDKYFKFYGFDIYNIEKQEWLPQAFVKQIYTELEIEQVPLFFEGQFESIEKCLNYVGKTNLGGEFGEGVVIKNMSRLNDPDFKKPFYLKLVCEKFSETAERKHTDIDLEALSKQEKNKELAQTIITRPRVEKLLNKMIDNGILPEDWGNEQMRIVSKNLSSDIYNDCIKEENDTVKQIDCFGKLCNSLGMLLAKEILHEKEKENE